MDASKVHIGTSGWSYKDWKGIFYPEKMKSTEWLTFYAESFDTTEINTSFYHLPKPQTVLGWIEKVPKDFKFCVKISRYLTHMKKLHDPEEPLSRFFDVFAPMQQRMGPVLVQLPPSASFKPDITEHFFQVLKRDYKDYDFALEVRHNTWLEKEPLAMMKRYNIGWVISQSGVGFPYEEHVTSEHVYFRFHGPGKLYASKYTDEEMAFFAEKFRRWRQGGHKLWIYFNNDWYGYGIDNANTLKQLLGIE